MDTDDHQHIFLFSPGNEKKVINVRATHIRRLFDILHVSLQRGDSHRARHAWAILARCKEVDWKEKWRMSLRLLDSGATLQSNSRKTEFLRTIMLQSPNQREHILSELVIHLINAGKYRDALDELELYLPSFPYHDNAPLHVYAGLICVYMAQPDDSGDQNTCFNGDMLGRAQIYFERAKSLDSDNLVAKTFLERVRVLQTRWSR
ncbi:hypothetical protein CONPUDRAFT_54664 [Coniophora puteana RWD-64-598 SS2]|uniref:Uncharacterized protein n=1 Tax=Coniophora puteana (strain RWD-64-598) TaxID=741705 RepID=A0A5M3MTR3_CONPW|nr:uncharacterized protein CONPUDRAFT_54664 [Coniophora puteana RWD-64-598 SS2]EIW82065.1 hypothetical protein CONPUDRAFT_54664 [Coniophora puteana RWD-64-598 SS2]